MMLQQHFILGQAGHAGLEKLCSGCEAAGCKQVVLGSQQEHELWLASQWALQLKLSSSAPPADASCACSAAGSAASYVFDGFASSSGDCECHVFAAARTIAESCQVSLPAGRCLGTCSRPPAAAERDGDDFGLQAPSAWGGACDGHGQLLCRSAALTVPGEYILGFFWNL